MMEDWKNGKKWREPIKGFKPNIPTFQYSD
jgi:hypothetical protein